MAKSGLFSVNAFGTFSRTTRDTLHHYDRIGLFSPEARGKNGYPLNEICVADDTDYLIRVMIVVRGKRSPGKAAASTGIAEKRDNSVWPEAENRSKAGDEP